MSNPTVAKQLELGFQQLEDKLDSIRIERRKTAKFLDAEVGQPILLKMKKLVPKPGYPGDKPGLKALVDTLTVVVRDYALGRWLVLVGPSYPAGAHGHLVEGEYSPRTSPPMTITKYIKPAIQSFERTAMRKIEDFVLKEIVSTFADGQRRLPSGAAGVAGAPDLMAQLKKQMGQ